MFIYNNINKLIILSRKQKLDKINEYNAANCFFISLENYDLIIKTLKRQFN